MLFRPEKEEDPDALVRLAEVQKEALPAELVLFSRQMTAAAAAIEHPVSHYLGNLAESAQPTQRHALSSVAKVLLNKPDANWAEVPWPELQYKHVSALRALLDKRVRVGIMATATANRWLSAVKRVLEEAWHLGQYPFEALEHARKVKGISGDDGVAGRLVELEELKLIFAACVADPRRVRGLRDAAAIATLYGGGFRRAEVTGIRFRHIDFGESITVKGKGNKTRTVPIRLSVLWEYLSRWAAELEQAPEAPFLRAVRKQQAENRDQCVGLKPLAGRDQAKLITLRVAQLKLEPFAPHDLRRTFASNLLRAGVDVLLVQKLMGHASVATTGKYDHRPFDDLRAAAEALPWF